MYHVRVVPTGSGAKAVQVIRYVRRKRVVVHHVGSARDDAEVDALLLAAQEWITQQTHQLAAFPDTTLDNVLLLNRCEYLGVYYTFLLEILNGLQQRIGYTNIDTSSLLNDLVTMRVMEPASKLRSIELLETYFGIRHRRQRFYEAAPRWLSLNPNYALGMHSLPRGLTKTLVSNVLSRLNPDNENHQLGFLTWG